MNNSGLYSSGIAVSWVAGDWSVGANYFSSKIDGEPSAIVGHLHIFEHSLSVMRRVVYLKEQAAAMGIEFTFHGLRGGKPELYAQCAPEGEMPANWCEQLYPIADAIGFKLQADF